MARSAQAQKLLTALWVQMVLAFQAWGTVTPLADQGSQEKELIRGDLGMASWGKSTWMKYLEREPLWQG